MHRDRPSNRRAPRGQRFPQRDRDGGGVLMAERAACGTWRSPIAVADLARSAISLDDLQVAGGTPYWIESRPTEGGRHVIVTPDRAGAYRGEPLASGDIVECTPAGFNARTRVHEYGGRPYTVARDGTLYFSHFPDQRLHAQRPGTAPLPITPRGFRYADYALDPAGAHLYCVREDHSAGGEPKNAIVVLDLAAGSPEASTSSAGTVLYAGSDFVAYPRVSADGRHLAWIAWNHPDMPWDATTLHVAELTPAGLANQRQIAGGPDESVLEPRWGAEGVLYFVSDRSGWWNLYRWGSNGRVEAALTLDAEIGGPLWTLGESSYALTGDGRAVVRCTRNAVDRLGVVALGERVRNAAVEFLDLPFVSFSNIQMLDETTAIAIAASRTAEPAVVAIDLASGAHQLLREPGTLELDAAWVSSAEPIEYAGAGGQPAHAFYYAPRNPDFLPLEGEKPPLVVKAHGGPTDHSGPHFNLGTQFWTSRGFAVLDVNYGGSSGYGRAYRERLNGNWGVVDVADVVAAVEHLGKGGLIDPARTAIRGGSAGGFTVLAALAFHDVFRAGADYFGVSDLEALARDTHKFESRYLDRLVAPLPQGTAIYEARAPIRHLEAFHAPL